MSNFDHENLIVYQLAVEIGRWFRHVDFPTGDSDERNQGIKASRSVVRNIAEGRSRRPQKSESYHYRIALGSAAEACSVLDNVDLDEGPEKQKELRRVGAMLRSLIRKVDNGEL